MNGIRDDGRYRVVINHEEQYSIWPADRENPKGWKDAGFAGSKDECLAHIEEVWTDMRPLSARDAAGGGLVREKGGIRERVERSLQQNLQNVRLN